MKKIFLSAICILALSLVSFSYANDSNTKDTLIYEVESFTSEDDTVNCRWRTCTISGGERTCGEWTNGTCEKDGNGTLTPNKAIIAE